MDLDAFAQLVRARRTNMVVDPERGVDTALIDRLCELAIWAPNHKRTWPWRFAAFRGDSRLRLGGAFVEDMIERELGDEGKRAKTATKYARTPAVLVVGCASHEHPTFHEENRDAVSAGIQNLLLGATAIGLASFWSTPPLSDGPRSLALCGFESDDRILAVIYLGWPTGQAQRPERPLPTITHLT